MPLRSNAVGLGDHRDWNGQSQGLPKSKLGFTTDLDGCIEQTAASSNLWAQAGDRTTVRDHQNPPSGSKQRVQRNGEGLGRPRSARSAGVTTFIGN